MVKNKQSKYLGAIQAILFFVGYGILFYSLEVLSVIGIIMVNFSIAIFVNIHFVKKEKNV
jgi:hypothetical protein